MLIITLRWGWRFYKNIFFLLLCLFPIHYSAAECNFAIIISAFFLRHFFFCLTLSIAIFLMCSIVAALGYLRTSLDIDIDIFGLLYVVAARFCLYCRWWVLMKNFLCEFVLIKLNWTSRWADRQKEITYRNYDDAVIWYGCCICMCMWRRASNHACNMFYICNDFFSFSVFFLQLCIAMPERLFETWNSAHICVTSYLLTEKSSYGIP